MNKLVVVLKICFVVMGYVWGILYFLVEICHEKWWALVPLISGLLAGYYVLKAFIKGGIYLSENQQVLALVGNMLANLGHLLKKAVQDKDPRYNRMFELLTLPPAKFQKHFS